MVKLENVAVIDCRELNPPQSCLTSNSLLFSTQFHLTSIIPTFLFNSVAPPSHVVPSVCSSTNRYRPLIMASPWHLDAPDAVNSFLEAMKKKTPPAATNGPESKEMKSNLNPESEVGTRSPPVRSDHVADTLTGILSSGC